MNQSEPIGRRRLLRTGIAVATAALAAPYVFSQDKTKPDIQGAVIGHGAFRYRVDTSWSNADPEKYPVNDCHEMVQVADGRLFLLTNHPKNNVLIYHKSGRLLDAWTLNFKGAHGLTLNREPAGEALYITDTGGRVVKTTLDGKTLLELPHPTQCGAYSEHTPYSPTETAIAPNGDIYVADGYGSQFILHFDGTGKFLSKFGGKSAIASSTGKFLQAHGVTLDNRGPEPLLVCTERIRNEFQWFTLDGKYLRTVYLPGAFVGRPVISGRDLLSAVCFGMYPGDYRMWTDRGFVVILDDAGKVVSAPGAHEPEYKDGKLQLLLQDQHVFRNAHDVCVDDDASLYVCQWASEHVYPYKLYRMS